MTTPKTAAEALAQIEATISGGERPTVNEQNAFVHFTALNRTLFDIRDIARAAIAAPARDQRDLQSYLDGKALQNDERVHLDISFNELKKLRAALRTWNAPPGQCS